jgi:hypothetical protein
MNETDPSAVGPECLRALKWDELVRRGDFVEGDSGGFEPWVGPNGFRADAFIKQIYRRQESPPAETQKQP